MTIAKCPFCGEEDFVHAEDDEWVRCGNCLAEGPLFDTLELSIASWNLVSRSAEHLRIAVEALEKIASPKKYASMARAITMRQIAQSALRELADTEHEL